MAIHMTAANTTSINKNNAKENVQAVIIRNVDKRGLSREALVT